MKLLRCSFVKPLFEGSLSRLTSPSSAYYAWPATFAPPRCNLLCLRARSEAPILRGRSPRHRRARRRARCQVRMSRGALSSCERAVRRRWLRGCTAHARCGQGQRRTAVTGAHWRAAREGRQDHSGRTRNAEATTAISGEGFWVGRRRRDCPHVHVPLILHKRTHLGRSVEPKGTACSHAARTGGQHNYDRLQDVVHSRAGMHL